MRHRMAVAGVLVLLTAGLVIGTWTPPKPTVRMVDCGGGIQVNEGFNCPLIGVG